MKKQLLFFLSLAFLSIVNAQNHYYQGREKLEEMLGGAATISLEKAVFEVENAWHEARLDEKEFNDQIESYAGFCQSIGKSGLIKYSGKDAPSVITQGSVFAFMTDSIPMKFFNVIVIHPPFQYNYQDFAGQKDWSSMFVTTLMATGKGNCHSLPLLYKLIMNKLGEKCWLALAPNHMYVKAYTKQSGLYNLELTTGHHPTDAWIKSSGFIHLDAIRNSLYMDTLTQKEEIALCLLDLAQGYDRKNPGNDGLFVSECCQTILKYYPDCINARLIQAEMITKRYLAIKDKKSTAAKKLKEEMEQAYTEIHKLGYRKMSDNMYRKWLLSSSQYCE